MKRINMLGLALTAALTVIALAAGTSSAVTLCEENKGHTEVCPEKKDFGAGHVVGHDPEFKITDLFLGGKNYVQI